MNQYHANAHPELYTLSNVGLTTGPTGKASRQRDNGLAHRRLVAARATKCTMLYAEGDPEPRRRHQIRRHVFGLRGLPPDEQRHLETLRAVHNLDFSRTRRHGEDPMTEASARRCRRSIIPCAFIRDRPQGDLSRRSRRGIVGMGLRRGRRLIEDMNERIVGLCRVYSHSWRPRDFMLWDNRCLLHKAGSYTANELHHSPLHRAGEVVSVGHAASSTAGISGMPPCRCPVASSRPPLGS